VDTCKLGRPSRWNAKIDVRSNALPRNSSIAWGDLAAAHTWGNIDVKVSHGLVAFCTCRERQLALGTLAIWSTMNLPGFFVPLLCRGVFGAAW
jgi:hypothetical protein